MSDSTKLRFEHAIWCLVFSYLSLLALVAFGFLTALVNFDFFILLFFDIIAFLLLVSAAIYNFRDAIDVSKEEGEQEAKKREKKKRETEEDNDIDIY